MANALKRFFRVLRGRLLWRYVSRLASSRAVTAAPAVIIAPHPDDEVFAAAGLIALKRRIGAPVAVLLLTRGEHAHLECCNMDPRALGAARQEQAQRVLAELGLAPADIPCLGLEDRHIPTEGEAGFPEAALALADQLARFPGAEIYCPHPLDARKDHQAAAQLAQAAIAAKNLSCRLNYYLVWGWMKLRLNRLPELAAARPWKLDITSVVENKRRAIEEYYAGNAPCGVPYIGILPHSFRRMFGAPEELFFSPAPPAGPK